MMRSGWRMAFALALAIAGASACVQPDDDPTNVHDLRVLGASFEPPELMVGDCSALQAGLASFAAGADGGTQLQVPPALLGKLLTPLHYQVLIADPAGDGRDINYDLAACGDPNNKTCTEVPEERVSYGSGVTHAGVFSATLPLGGAIRDDGTPLLVSVYADDIYKGLGGLRMPVVIHLTAGTEEIYAMKLMVFSCAFFPDSTQNTTPILPGVMLNDAPWLDGTPFEVDGTGDVSMSLEPLDDLEENYVVPALYLSEVHLKESWRVSWYTTWGTISPSTTGGVDVGGEEPRHIVTWHPKSTDSPQDVTFWLVVRDGRGGESWIERTVHLVP